MSWALEPDLQEPIDGGVLITNLNADGFKIVNLAAATNPSDAVRFDQISTGSSAWALVTGTTMAVVGGHYATDTSAAVGTITLPATPAAGAEILIKDAHQTWATRNLTIGRNGLNINGVASNFVANVSGDSLRCVFIGTNAAGTVVGWSIS